MQGEDTFALSKKKFNYIAQITTKWRPVQILSGSLDDITKTISFNTLDYRAATQEGIISSFEDALSSLYIYDLIITLGFSNQI